jgi:hypothetical protein
MVFTKVFDKIHPPQLKHNVVHEPFTILSMLMRIAAKVLDHPQPIMEPLEGFHFRIVGCFLGSRVRLYCQLVALLNR